MNQPLIFVVFILSFFQLGLSFSHHGFNAHYDVSNSVFIEGTIKEFRYINPHSFVYVETTNADGEQETRWCEMQASSQLRIKGINESSLQSFDIAIIALASISSAGLLAIIWRSKLWFSK